VSDTSGKRAPYARYARNPPPPVGSPVFGTWIWGTHYRYEGPRYGGKLRHVHTRIPYASYAQPCVETPSVKLPVGHTLTDTSEYEKVEQRIAALRTAIQVRALWSGVGRPPPMVAPPKPVRTLPPVQPLSPVHDFLREMSREKACEVPRRAYDYARHVDQRPENDTRRAACGDPTTALLYAQHVDQRPRDDTREAASQSLATKPVYTAWETQLRRSKHG